MERKGNPVVGLLLIITVVVVLVAISLITVVSGLFRDTQEPCDVTGEFVSAQMASYKTLATFGGMSDIVWGFTVEVEDDYAGWTSQGTITDIETGETEIITRFTCMASGTWEGPLPPEGHQVYILSFGDVNSVRISDMETLEVYQSEENVRKLPVYTYYYRVYSRKTGEVTKQGTVSAKTSSEMVRKANLRPYEIDNRYVVHTWMKGETPIPPFKP